MKLEVDGRGLTQEEIKEALENLRMYKNKTLEQWEEIRKQYILGIAKLEDEELCKAIFEIIIKKFPHLLKECKQ